MNEFKFEFEGQAGGEDHHRFHQFRDEKEIRMNKQADRPKFAVSLPSECLNNDFRFELETIRALNTCDDPDTNNDDLEEFSPLLIHAEHNDIRAEDGQLKRKMQKGDWLLALEGSEGGTKLEIVDRGVVNVLVNELEVVSVVQWEKMDVSGALVKEDGRLRIFFGQNKDNNIKCANKRKRDVVKPHVKADEGIRMNISSTYQRTRDDNVFWDEVVKDRIAKKAPEELRSDFFRRMEQLQKNKTKKTSDEPEKDPYLFHMCRLRARLIIEGRETIADTEFDLLNSGEPLTKKGLEIKSMEHYHYCSKGNNDKAFITVSKTIRGGHYSAEIEDEDSGDVLSTHPVVISGTSALVKVDLEGLSEGISGRNCRLRIRHKITKIKTNAVKIKFFAHFDPCILCQRTDPNAAILKRTWSCAANEQPVKVPKMDEFNRGNSASPASLNWSLTSDGFPPSFPDQLHMNNDYVNSNQEVVDLDEILNMLDNGCVVPDGPVINRGIIRRTGEWFSLKAGRNKTSSQRSKFTEDDHGKWKIFKALLILSPLFFAILFFD